MKQKIAAGLAVFVGSFVITDSVFSIGDVATTEIYSWWLPLAMAIFMGGFWLAGYYSRA